VLHDEGPGEAHRTALHTEKDAQRQVLHTEKDAQRHDIVLHAEKRHVYYTGRVPSGMCSPLRRMHIGRCFTSRRMHNGKLYTEKNAQRHMHVLYTDGMTMFSVNAQRHAC
jgi:hypothetical protein